MFSGIHFHISPNIVVDIVGKAYRDGSLLALTNSFSFKGQSWLGNISRKVTA
jgi:hypothetical protein